MSSMLLLEVTLDTPDLPDALCKGLGYADYFHSDDYEDRQLAKKICADCPVQQLCLDAALARGERFGVFGGQDMDDVNVPIHLQRERGDVEPNVPGVSWEARQGRWAVRVGPRASQTFGGYHVDLVDAERRAVELWKQLEAEDVAA